jgi:hypothetical protein
VSATAVFAAEDLEEAFGDALRVGEHDERTNATVSTSKAAVPPTTHFPRPNGSRRIQRPPK